MAADSNGCEVRVTTRDGGQYQGRVEYALGEPENMLSAAQFEGKLRYLNGDLLPENRITALIDACNRLEELDDVGELLRLTAVGVKA